MANPYPIIEFGTNVPTSTDIYYQKGTIVMNPEPAKGQIAGWLCTVAGRPGTWVPFVWANQGGGATVTAAAVLPSGNSYILVNITAGGTCSLPVAADHSVGHILRVKNIDDTALTLATNAAGQYQDAAAITLAQNASVTLLCDGVDTWHKID